MITGEKPRRRKTGIFCVESWSARMTDRTTVRPLLEILEHEAGIPYIHRIADDQEGLSYLLARSTGYTGHRVVYLACHGESGTIGIGGRQVAIEDLAADLDSGVLRNKTVYFGSCATGTDRAALRAFRERTQAEVVCAYADPRGVDWLSAGAFELLLMRSLTKWARGKTGLRHLRSDPAGKSLWRALKFVTEPSSA